MMTPKQHRQNRRSYLVGIIPILLVLVVVRFMRPLPEGIDVHSVIGAVLSFSLLSFGVAWAIAWDFGFSAGFKEGSDKRG